MSTLNEKRQRTADNLKRVSFRDTRVASMVMMLFEAFGIDYNNGYAARDDLRMRMVKLIEPEPERTCHLTMTDHEYETSYRCNACKRVVWLDYKGNPKPKFCPNCGAKVVVE